MSELLPVCWQWQRSGADAYQGQGAGWSKVHLFDNWSSAGGYAMCGVVPNWTKIPAQIIEGDSAYSYAEACKPCHRQEDNNAE